MVFTLMSEIVTIGKQTIKLKIIGHKSRKYKSVGPTLGNFAHFRLRREV